MVAPAKPAGNTLTIAVEVEPEIAAQAEAIAQHNNYANLSVALAETARRMSLERRMPFETSNDNERPRGPYAGATFSRMAELARRSGEEAVSKAHAAGRSTSFLDENNRVVRLEPDGTVVEAGRER